MTDSLTVFGTDYTGVAGIKATGTGNGILTYIRPQGNIAITSNTASGSSLDVSQYATATVNVSGSGGNDFVITVSWNSSTELWEPDCTFAEVQAAYAAGKNIVVDASGASEDATADGEYDSSNSRLRYWVHQYDGDAGIYETPYDFNASGATRHSATVHYITPQGTKQITANGQGIDVTEYASVDVAVPSSQPNLQAKTNIAPSTSSQTITADSGYDGLSSVQINAMPSGTAGTPTASKSISGQTATVTPSVTNTTGYITGSTKTGTAVTVTASELVSFVTYYTSSSAPTSSQGSNGDIWLKTVS